MIKKFALISLLGFISALPIYGADTLANWGFETVLPSGPSGTGTDNGPYLPDSGILLATASATGHHASSATTWSSPAGASSANSFSANNWTVNDYFQFSLSTIGYQNVNVVFAQLGSSTGPANYRFQYSTDGTSFTNFGSTITLTSNSTYKSTSFDLSIVPGINNQANVYFRVVDISTTSIGNGTVASGGTGRIDNFIVTADLIPEPSTYASLLFGGLFLFVALRMRRKAHA